MTRDERITANENIALNKAKKEALAKHPFMEPFMFGLMCLVVFMMFMTVAPWLINDTVQQIEIWMK